MINFLNIKLKIRVFFFAGRVVFGNNDQARAFGQGFGSIAREFPIRISGCPCADHCNARIFEINTGFGILFGWIVARCEDSKLGRTKNLWILGSNGKSDY